MEPVFPSEVRPMPRAASSEACAGGFQPEMLPAGGVFGFGELIEQIVELTHEDVVFCRRQVQTELPTESPLPLAANRQNFLK